MASDQVRREKIPSEKEEFIEKDGVPKMTTHFESLSEKAKDLDITGGKETPHQSGKDRSFDTQGKSLESHELGTHEFESLSDQMEDKQAEAGKGREKHEEKMRVQGPYSVGKFEVSGEGGEGRGKMEGYEEKGRSIGEQGKEVRHEENQRGGGMQGKQGDGQKQEQHSLEQIAQLRGQAQESSMEALKVLEERYNQTKEEARRKLGSATEYAAEKGSQAKDSAKQTSQYVSEKRSQAKDTLYSAGQTSKEYTVLKVEQAKEYAVEKAKEAAVETTKKVGEKAAAAKDVTVQSGKGVAEYAGKIAADVKDSGVVAGWNTAHYTTEKAVEGAAAVAKAAQSTTEKVIEGTKAAVGQVEGVAEYGGHKALEIVSKPLGAAKEAAASTGESMKEYTARKKEEAQRELQAKRGERQGTESSYTGGEKTVEERSYAGGQDRAQQQSLITRVQEKAEDVARPITNTIQETFQGGPEQRGEQEEKQPTEYREDQSRGGGVLQAIGETVVEIAQQTKDLVIGERETGEKMVGCGSNQAKEGKQREAGRGQ